MTHNLTKRSRQVSHYQVNFVQLLVGLGNLSALQNIEVSINQGVHDLHRLIQASLSAYVELLTSE